MTRHTILVPLDGTDFSREIVPGLLHLFDPEVYELRLLRVGEIPRGLVMGRPIDALHWLTAEYSAGSNGVHQIYATQEEASARAALEDAELLVQHQLRKAGYAVTMVARFGDPVEEIVAEAAEQRVDCIAMAAHSWSGLRGIFVGSVTDQVFERSHVPVLLFRPQLA